MKHNKMHFTRLIALALTFVMIFSLFSTVFATNEIIGQSIQGVLCEDLPIDTTFVLKNVGTGQYLTFSGENSNMYLSSYEYDRQSIQLIQDDSGYKLKHKYIDENNEEKIVYAAFIIDISGQNVYHMWGISSANHTGTNWLFYKIRTDENGNSIFRIKPANDMNYSMTAYQFGGTGLTYATIYPNSNNNLNQEWILEGYFPRVNVDYGTEEIALNINDKVQIVSDHFTRFESKNDSIASIDNNGIITAKKLGSTTITATTASGMEADFDLYIKLPNGKYYISNSQNNMMLTYNSNALLSSINGGDEQKWYLAYDSEGYYSISCIISNNNVSYTYYLTATNDYDVSFSPFIADPMNSEKNSSRQLWSFNTSTNDNIIIKPMCYDSLYLSTYINELAYDNYEYYADLSSYTDNSDLSDEWNIFQKPDAVLLSSKEFNEYSRDKFLNKASDISKNACTNDFDSLEKAQMISLLQSTDTIFIFTHGNKNSINISDNEFLSSSDIENLDLSNLKLVVLLSCSCAEGGYDPTREPTNFLETLIYCGAETVIGFDEKINVANAANFISDFIDKYFVNNQDLLSSTNSSIDEINNHIVIGGNVNLKND